MAKRPSPTPEVSLCRAYPCNVEVNIKDASDIRNGLLVRQLSDWHVKKVVHDLVSSGVTPRDFFAHGRSDKLRSISVEVVNDVIQVGGKSRVSLECDYRFCLRGLCLGSTHITELRVKLS